jgi:hypothetical protein
MRCQTARGWITRDLAGELSPGRAGRLAQHVEGCEGCRREQTAYAALDRMLGTLILDGPLPPRLEQDTLRRVRLAAADDVGQSGSASGMAAGRALVAWPVLLLAVRGAALITSRLGRPRCAAQRPSSSCQAPARDRHHRKHADQPPPELAARFVSSSTCPAAWHGEAPAPRCIGPRRSTARRPVERMITPLGGALLAILFAAAPASAQWGGRAWQQLSPEEQRRAWQNYQHYQQLPQQRQQLYENRFQHFQTLPPQEQQRLRQNYEAYRNQDPAARQQFNERYRRWKQGGQPR